MSESDYILGQVIARGGMAEVYRGLHVGQDGFRRLVAIKRILQQHSSNSEFADMFRDEAHIGQRLQHANVVKVECFSIIDQCPSIVMEFVDGSDLRSILAETERSKTIRRIPIPMCLYIIAEAARGLHYAHTRSDDVTGRPLDLVHRDISPQNILVSYNGEVKVTDFGIASADRDFKNTETKAGIVKGKYSYMSPEQISAKKVDPRTDVFALSIVLWEMLAMRRLFSADNEVEVIEMVKNCRIPAKLRDINNDISAELDSIVMRGLAKDPSKRFPNMDEMERAIRSLINKDFPNFSVGDLGNLLKKVLSVKHEASQLEIKKMLTATGLKASGKSKSGVELDIAASDALKKSLTVSRHPTGSPFGMVVNRPTERKQPSAQKPSSLSPQRLGRIDNGRADAPKPWSRTSLLIALLVVVASFAAILFKVQSNAAKDALSVNLRTSPSTVRLRVNGQPFKNGHYVRTPLSVRLERGANILEISRTGYQSETVAVDTSKSEHKSIPTVNLTAKVPFIVARFTLVGQKPIILNINDGFSVAALSGKQPIHEVRDLVEGQMIEVQVSEKSKPSFRCKVSTSRLDSDAVVQVTVDPTRDRCEISSSKDRSGP